MGDVHQPSDAELEILQVVWKEEPVTVRKVHEVLSESKKVVYTTTLKQMQRMTNKGILERKGSGKSHQYSAIVKEENVQKSLYQKLVNSAFKGSVMKLVMHALGNAKTTDEEIEALETFLEQQKKRPNNDLTSK